MIVTMGVEGLLSQKSKKKDYCAEVVLRGNQSPSLIGTANFPFLAVPHLGKYASSSISLPKSPDNLLYLLQKFSIYSSYRIKDHQQKLSFVLPLTSWSPNFPNSIFASVPDAVGIYEAVSLGRRIGVSRNSLEWIRQEAVDTP